MNKKYNHDELVEIGLKWIKKNGFPVAAGEIKTLIREIPDVIGFSAHASMIIECKCSKSDFYADFKKPERVIDGLGVGNYRLYLAPKGVLKLDSIPESWGLLEVNEKGRIEVTRFKNGNIFSGNTSNPIYSKLTGDDLIYHHESHIENERRILYSILRRMK